MTFCAYLQEQGRPAPQPSHVNRERPRASDSDNGLVGAGAVREGRDCN